MKNHLSSDPGVSKYSEIVCRDVCLLDRIYLSICNYLSSVLQTVSKIVVSKL